MNIVRQGKMLTVYDGPINFITKLENVPHEFCWGPRGDVYLEEKDSFQLPSPLYDVEKDFRNRILKSFRGIKNKNMGVHLEGQKGAGKSVTAKLLAMEAQLPIIMVNKSIPTQIDFMSFINSLQCDLVILIDEFEKVIPEKSNEDGQGMGGAGVWAQKSFLSFMDGMNTSSYKRLFIFTTNDKINDKFENRPSRVRFYKKYRFMDKEVYDMIVKEKLNNKEFEEDLRKNLTVFEANIDLLTTIIEEINIQGEPYSTFKEIFNHKPSYIKYFREKSNDKGEFHFHDTVEVRQEISRDENYIEGIGRFKVIDQSHGDIFITVEEGKWIKKENAEGKDIIDESEDDQVFVREKVIYKLRKYNGTDQLKLTI